jgi:hypothetical protein
MLTSEPESKNQASSKKATNNLEFLSCFYYTQEMRDKFSKNYPTEWSKRLVLVPGRIVCTPELGLFCSTLVSLEKNLSYFEKTRQIREQMENSNVIIAEPQDRKYTTLENL